MWFAAVLPFPLRRTPLVIDTPYATSAAQLLEKRERQFWTAVMLLVVVCVFAFLGSHLAPDIVTPPQEEETAPEWWHRNRILHTVRVIPPSPLLAPLSTAPPR